MIICLTGKAGAGKGMIANYLAQRYEFRVISFAGPIRKMLISGLGLDQDDFEHGEKEKVIEWLGKSPRQLSQTLGTEWGRQIVDKDLWIKVAVRKITQLAKTGFDVVIDDCRFDNEVNAMVDLDAVLVKVTRPQTIEVFPHISERGITLPDELFHRIHNDGTIEQLHEQVDGLLNRLMPGAAI